VQERQQVAQRVLPILTASENNFYTQDNLQKLALRLRIAESDLLAWAQELKRIEQAKKPKYRPPQDAAPFLDEDYLYGNSEEAPPFLDFDDSYAPPDVDDDYLPAQLAAKPGQAQLSSRSSSRATEAYCLRMLLLEPAMLARVNRKLRELASDNEQLLDGPLAALNTEDFSQGDYRALLDALHTALQQDDAEPLDYLQEVLDETLIHELTALLLDEAEEVHRQMGKRMEGEFDDIWKEFVRTVRPSFNTQADVVRRALQVRHQRLEREQQEVKFLLEDAQRQHDKDAERLYYEQTIPTMRALRLIQQELKQASVAW
jgi:hypothetical protein